MIGDDGSGYFNVAYQIYTFMFIVATAGFPIAISKMVAESMARNDETDAKRVFQTAISFLAVIGLAGSIILFVFAKQLAGLVGIPDAELGIKAISPAVFFVSLASSMRGYFQGRQNMFPTAGSEVIESSGKMVIGLLMASFFMGMTIVPNLDKVIDFCNTPGRHRPYAYSLCVCRSHFWCDCRNSFVVPVTVSNIHMLGYRCKAAC